MKILVGVFVLCCCIGVWAYAADTEPAKPQPIQGMAPKVLIIGPKDQLAVARKISGKTRLMTALSSAVKASEVEFYVDGNSIGKCTARPFRADVDTSTLSVGEHLFKAVARDAGNELWSATSKARVEAATDAAAPADTGGPTSTPAEPGGDVAVASQPENQLAVTQPESAPSQPATGPVSVDKPYRSRDYAFAVNYPSTWTVRDNTPSTAKEKSGEFWVIFGDEPLTINIHARQLSQGATADTFALHNPYVNSWTRKTVLGKPAFATTTGSAAGKDVIHRLIIIDKDRALMLNCIDKTGRPIDESAEIFGKVVNSLQITARSSAPVKKGKG